MEREGKLDWIGLDVLVVSVKIYASFLLYR